ncbi:MAG: endonuclease III [Deltaproteobacteria bacterium]|nr:MAG: endonuclease III [Deltaproteobacteria bacterium]
MGKINAEAKRLEDILGRLTGGGPPPKPGLDYDTPWRQLVATLLSAQCTDARVNMVTPSLFAKYPGPEEMAAADITELEEAIHSIGLFRNKAKNLKAMAEKIVTGHGGEVPPVREALEALPGVGRKTASVVLAQGFGVPAFAVDTHVGRVSMRLGFSKTKDPLKVEEIMCALLPPERWGEAHLILIMHGRYCCKAQRPLCGECKVFDLCRWPEKG